LVNSTEMYSLDIKSTTNVLYIQADTERLIHAYFTSRFDYCNALLSGLPTKVLGQLQKHTECCRVSTDQDQTEITHYTGLCEF
jgi:hypothetical protein